MDNKLIDESLLYASVEHFLLVLGVSWNRPFGDIVESSFSVERQCTSDEGIVIGVDVLLKNVEPITEFVTHPELDIGNLEPIRV